MIGIFNIPESSTLTALRYSTLANYNRIDILSLFHKVYRYSSGNKVYVYLDAVFRYLWIRHISVFCRMIGRRMFGWLNV